MYTVNNKYHEPDMNNNITSGLLDGTRKHQNVPYFQWMTFCPFILNYYSLQVLKRRRVRHSVVVTTFIISLHIKESIYLNGMN